MKKPSLCTASIFVSLSLCSLFIVIGRSVSPLQAQLSPPYDVIDDSVDKGFGLWTDVIGSGYGSGYTVGRYDARQGNRGTAIAYWQIKAIPNYQDYVIYATWQPLPGSGAKKAIFDINMGYALSNSVFVDMTRPPSGITDKGVIWQEIGRGRFETAVDWNHFLSVRLFEAGNTVVHIGTGAISADAIRLMTPSLCNDGFCRFGETPESCPKDCAVSSSVCGNSTLTPAGADGKTGTDDDEQCDDGNVTSGDGCSATCKIEKGFLCKPGAERSLCMLACGDGHLAPAGIDNTPKTSDDEWCDDGNMKNGDGCSASCMIEPGFGCAHMGDGSYCFRLCSDGHIGTNEQCDDRNLKGGDGCSPTCQIETGWDCPTEGWPCIRSVCGNGVVSPVGPDGKKATSDDEECDDGNTVSADGCGATCKIEAGFDCPLPAKTAEKSVCRLFCGNGVINKNRGEQCDDGNAMSGDGCSDKCLQEQGWVCPIVGKPCASLCGNGAFNTGEQCDDRNATGGDGCSTACRLEQGWSCPIFGKPCTRLCGNGIFNIGEQCDDKNAVSGDGCSSTCQTEVGWSCPIVGKSCVSLCGNGILNSGEQCDDKNAVSGDGCSSTCQGEQGWACPTIGLPCTRCGNGVIDSAEQCDDNNRMNGDGCSGLCQGEQGWVCPTAGLPCTRCGNGIVDTGEQCDFRAAKGAEFCSTTCTIIPLADPVEALLDQNGDRVVSAVEATNMIHYAAEAVRQAQGVVPLNTQLAEKFDLDHSGIVNSADVSMIVHDLDATTDSTLKSRWEVFKKLDLNSDYRVETTEVQSVVTSVTADINTRSTSLRNDINGDGSLNAKDILIIINFQNSHQPLRVPYSGK